MTIFLQMENLEVPVILFRTSIIKVSGDMLHLRTSYIQYYVAYLREQLWPRQY